jgi:serine/threonine protein kinase
MPDHHAWSELAAGDEFAGYRIEGRLGRGGMGLLYLAVEPGLERRVALKLIAPEAAAEEVFAKRFAEESRIAASIEHPNVVPIYRAGEQDGVPWIAMRYVAGSDLARKIEREGRLSPGDAVRLISQVGNGLDAIHAAGLVHRDVKPANVLVSAEHGTEHAYITDFGVARNVATRSGLTQTGRFVGTIDYVAPEQISGGRVDARADVYALGCLLYKALTGEVPFPREAEAARLYAHLNDPPPAPSTLAAAVPMALDDVVARAMEKEPGDRYPSAGDLGRAAEAALAGTTVPIPERTVATGAAATVETQSPPPLPPTRASEPVPPAREPTPSEPTVVPPVGPPTEETRVEAPASGGQGGSGRRPLLLGAGALALVAAVVVAIVLASGGGGSGGSGDTAVADTQPREETQPEPKEETGEKPVKEEQKEKQEEQKPKTLTKSQLIAKGDAICEKSQAKFGEYRETFPEGENEANVPYSRLLVDLSRTAMGEYEALVPPASLSKQYAAYVKAQDEVAGWDRDALAAAEEEDLTAYLEARATRDETAPKRTELSEAVGFHVCAGSNA